MRHHAVGWAAEQRGVDALARQSHGTVHAAARVGVVQRGASLHAEMGFDARQQRGSRRTARGGAQHQAGAVAAEGHAQDEGQIGQLLHQRGAQRLGAVFGHPAEGGEVPGEMGGLHPYRAVLEFGLEGIGVDDWQSEAVDAQPRHAFGIAPGKVFRAPVHGNEGLAGAHRVSGACGQHDVAAARGHAQ